MSKKPVTERALLGRINRKLANEGLKLVRTRPGTRAEAELGACYTIDVNGNAIRDTHHDLETFARELGVLQPYEHLTN